MAGEKSAALFIDFENILASVKNQLQKDYIDWRRLLQALEPYGRFVIRNAYANWGAHYRHQSGLMSCGIQPINAIGRGKNVADVVLAVDAMEVLYRNREIETFVIASGDTDFTHLVHRLREQDKRVVGVGVRGTVAHWLIEAMDDFIFYDDLIATPPSQPERPQSPIQPQPERPQPIVQPQPERPQPPAQPERLVVSEPGNEDPRGQLRRLLENVALLADWVHGAKLGLHLRREPQFLQLMKQAGFTRLAALIEANSDLIETRQLPGGDFAARRRTAVPQNTDSGSTATTSQDSATTTMNFGSTGELMESLRQELDSLLPEDSWINGATLAARWRLVDPVLDEKLNRLRFARFRTMLEAFPDLAEVRIAPGKTHIEVRRRQPGNLEESIPPTLEPNDAPPPAETAPEAAYLARLRERGIQVTPSPHRPDVILHVYDIFQNQKPPTFNVLKALVLEAYASNTEVSSSLVESVMRQLFSSFAFEFDRQSGVKILDCPFRLQPFIMKRLDLLDHMDMDLLKKIGASLPEGFASVDPALAARILYGSDKSALARRVQEFLTILQSTSETSE